MSRQSPLNRAYNGQNTAGPFANHGYSKGPRLAETPQPPPLRPTSGSSAASSSFGQDSSISDGYHSAGANASSNVEDQLKYYAGLREFLNIRIGHEATSNVTSSRARVKLQRLTTQQVHELSQDAHDELLRRRMASGNNATNVPPFLRPRRDFHEKRNHARHKLSTLQPGRFQDLATDILCEIERRNPHFNEMLLIAQSEKNSPGSGMTSPRGMPNAHLGNGSVRHSPPAPGRPGAANANSTTPTFVPLAAPKQGPASPDHNTQREVPAGPSNKERLDADKLLPPISPLRVDFNSDAKPSAQSTAMTNGPQPKSTNSNTIVPVKSTLVEEDLDDVEFSSPPHFPEKSQPEANDRIVPRETGAWSEAPPKTQTHDGRTAKESSPVSDSASLKTKSTSAASRNSAAQRGSDLPAANDTSNKSTTRSSQASAIEVEKLRIQLENQWRNVELAEKSLAESANSTMYKGHHDDYDLSQLEQEKTELEEEVSDAQRRLLKAEKSNRRLEKKLQDLEAQLADTNLNNETERANHDFLIFEKDERNRDLQVQIDVLHHMVEERTHEDESGDDERHKSERQRETAELQSQLQELSQQKANLEKDLDSTRNANIEKEEERDALRKELSRLSERLSLKEQESKEIEQLRKKWQEKQESLEALLNIERNHSDTLQDGLDRITATKEEKSREMDDLQARYEKLQSESVNKDQLAETRSTLEQKIGTLESRNAELQVEVSALQKELDETRENAVDGKELIEAKNDLEKQTVCVEVLQLHLQQAEQKVIELEAALKGASKHGEENPEMKTQLEAALKEIDEHEKVKAELREQEGSKYEQLKQAHLLLQSEHQEYLERESELKKQLEEHLQQVESNAKSHEKWKLKHQSLKQDFQTQQKEWQSRLQAEQQTRNALNEQLSSQAGGDEWKTRYEELDEQHAQLQTELELQRQTTEEVREQAATFLAEMRMLSEEKETRLDSEENNSDEIDRLRNEVKLWQNRYESLRTQDNSTVESSNKADYVNMFAENSDEFTSSDGAVSSKQVNKFPSAIDGLLRKARAGESDTVTKQAIWVVSAIGGIRRELKSSDVNATPEISDAQRDVLGATKVLVTASKNFCESVSLPPVSLNVAASNLSANVLALLRIIKVRPPTNDESPTTRIPSYTSDAPSQIRSEVSRDSVNTTEYSNDERPLPPLPPRSIPDETDAKPALSSQHRASVNAITLLKDRNQVLTESSDALITTVQNTNPSNFDKSRNAFHGDVNTICTIIDDFIQYTDVALNAPSLAGSVTDAAFTAPVLTILEMFALRRESLLNVAGLLDKDSKDNFASTAERLTALIKDIQEKGNELVSRLTHHQEVD